MASPLTISDSEFRTAASVVWSNPHLLEHIASFLHRNCIPGSIRLVCKYAASLFRREMHRTLHLSEPCPVHYFTDRWGAERAVFSLNYKQRLQLVCLTAASGVLANLEVALRASGCIPVGAMMEAAAAAGKKDACGWLWARGCPWGEALAAAGEAGHLELFQYMLVMGCPCPNDAVYAAVRGGNWDLICRLCLDRPTQETPIKADKLLAAAAAGCSLETFKALHSNWTPPIWLWGPQRLSDPSQQARVMAAAAGSPTPDWQAKMEWLEGQGYRKTSKAAAAAALHCDGLGRLEWLQERGYPMRESAFEDPTLFETAGHYGNINIALHLLSEFSLYRFAGHAATAAAAAGRLDFLTALHEVCNLEDSADVIALQGARGGHLPVVAWAAHDLGYNMREDRGLLSAAAESGNVALMEWVWLETEGEARSPNGMASAAKGGCEQALMWMVDHGFQDRGDRRSPFTQAASNGDMHTLKWLHGRLDSPMPRGLFGSFARVGAPPRAIRWLTEEVGGPLDWAEVDMSQGTHNVYTFALAPQSVPTDITSTTTAVSVHNGEQ